MIVNCKGAKTGIERVIPLIAIPDEANDKDLILIASNWGKQKNYSWYYNLKANPLVKLRISGAQEDYQATEIQDGRYDELWEQAIAMYSGYNKYKKRTKRQKIDRSMSLPIRSSLGYYNLDKFLSPTIENISILTQYGGD